MQFADSGGEGLDISADDATTRERMLRDEKSYESERQTTCKPAESDSNKASFVLALKKGLVVLISDGRSLCHMIQNRGWRGLRDAASKQDMHVKILAT